MKHYKHELTQEQYYVVTYIVHVDIIHVYICVCIRAVHAAVVVYIKNNNTFFYRATLLHPCRVF